MTTPDTRPCKPPVEGHYAVLRNGMIEMPSVLNSTVWEPKTLRGTWYNTGRYLDDALNYNKNLDIIATIDPALMSALADGRVGELIAKSVQLHEQISADDSITCNVVTDMTLASHLKITRAIQGSTP